MICDVCNAEVAPNEEKTVSAEIFQDLMNHGFGIDKTNIEILTSSGMSRDEAIKALRQQYSTFTSDWLLCPNCFLEATTMVRKDRPTQSDNETPFKQNNKLKPGKDFLGPVFFAAFVIYLLYTGGVDKVVHFVKYSLGWYADLILVLQLGGFIIGSIILVFDMVEKRAGKTWALIVVFLYNLFLLPPVVRILDSIFRLSS